MRAAYQNERMGLVDNWLRHVQDVAQKYAVALSGAGSAPERVNRLCELNVLEQVANVCQTTVIQDAWARGQDVTVHGWIYALADGLIRDLNVAASSPNEFLHLYQAAQDVYLRP